MIVIDIDVPEGSASLRVLERLGRSLPPTLAARTGSGGLHLYLRAPEHELRNAVGSLPGVKRDLPGIDLRAEGGYVLAPPSLHISGERYSWLDASVPLAPPPAWLRQPPRVIVPIPPAASFTGDGTAHGRAVLENALASLRSAPVGQRNNTLNRWSFIVAKHVRAGHLLESTARAELTRAALPAGLTEWETTRTISSAFRAAR